MDSKLSAENVKPWALAGNRRATTNRYAREAGAPLQPELLTWVKAHPTAWEAQFVYKAWLDAKGERALIAPELLAWVKTHPTALAASFVYKAWLDAKGERALIAPELLAWVKAHPLAVEAQFVYKAWLDAQGERALIAPELLAWIKTHPTLWEAQFVYKAWLDARGERELIAPELLAWVQTHPLAEGVDYVCGAWLQAGGDYSQVQKYVEDWVHQHRDDPQAVYLLKEVSKQRRLDDPVLRNVLYWCQRHADHPDAIWRLSRLGKCLLRQRMGTGVLAASQAVVQAQAACNNPHASGVEGVLVLVLGAPELQAPERRRQVLACYGAWLRHPRAFTGPTHTRRFVERIEWVYGLRELLLHGGIDIAQHQSALRRFLSWLGGWLPQNRQAVAALLAELAGLFPSELWNLIQA